MGCKGIHQKYAEKGSFYKNNLNHCTVCNVWLSVEYTRCPCCGWLVRSRKRKKTPYIAPARV